MTNSEYKNQILLESDVLNTEINYINIESDDIINTL